MGVSTAPEQHRRRLRSRWEPLDVEAVAPATSVAVMAPALTESGPQKLDDLLPPLPSSGFLTQEQAAQVCQNREVLAKFVVSANVQPTKIDEQCLRGISKDFIRDVINSKYGNGLDNLSTLANSSDLIASKLAEVEAKKENEDKNYNNYKEEIIKEEIEEEEEKVEDIIKKIKLYKNNKEITNHNNNKKLNELKQSLILKGCKLIDVNNAIMNESSIIDNKEEEMGFIKTNEIVPIIINDNINDCPSIDKNIIDDVDNIMELNNDLTTNVNSDIDSNVDDLLRAIKSMEGDTTINDSNIVSDDTNNIFPITDGFTSFDERVLLNDVMNSFVNDNINININDTIIEQQINNNINNLVLQQKNIQDKQFKSERKCAFLQRRLRKIQTKLIGRHIAEENTGVIEIAHNSVKKYFHQEFENIRANKIGNIDYKLPDIGGNIDTFLQKIEKSCLAQSNSVNRQRMSCRYFGAGSRDNYTTGTASQNSNNHYRYPVFGQAKIKIDGNEIENIAGSLANNLHTIQLDLDSDCTASSSGGESCDEMQTFNNLQQHQLPITKRAAWQYVQDRAGIAARWTWLQAQITDLEYRIRHHNELQRQIRSTKGHVVLESINGYNHSLPENSNTPLDQTETCCRTRPFIWESYRKRKLIRVDGLHEYSKRAAKSSNIRCNCDHGLLPSCALCTGRTDPTQPQEPFEQLSLSERIAFVDTCYHPVLSFPDEVSQNTHFDAIMKSSEWQQKILRGNLTRLPRIKDKDIPERRNSKTKLSDNRAKYTTSSSSSSRMKKSSSTILTDRIKKKILKGKGGNDMSTHARPLYASNRKKFKALGSIEGIATTSAIGDDDASFHSSSSKHSSPVPSPLHHMTTTITATSTEKLSTKEKSSNSSHGRLRQSSYDINNIVIPYSVAASMKPEKLQYKEILTPKWRLCGDVVKQYVKNGVIHRLSQDSDSEDISDEAIALRHERSEREENKRYMKGANRIPQGRLRNHRRADSRADSGANTPDPMSPQTGDFGGDVTSPPATPLSVQDTEHNNTMDGQRNSLQYAMRRRTFSSSMRIAREESGNVAAEDVHEVLPYDPRLFPLSEEVYEKMLEVMPDGHWQASPGSLCLPEEEKRDDDAEVDSHESDATESAYCDADGDVEDPNDPEWTVADVRDAEKERIRPTAKR